MTEAPCLSLTVAIENIICGDDISGYVARIDVSDLKTILTAMREHGDGSLKYTILDN